MAIRCHDIESVTMSKVLTSTEIDFKTYLKHMFRCFVYCIDFDFGDSQDLSPIDEFDEATTDSGYPLSNNQNGDHVKENSLPPVWISRDVEKFEVVVVSFLKLC